MYESQKESEKKWQHERNKNGGKKKQWTKCKENNGCKKRWPVVVASGGVERLQKITWKKKVGRRDSFKQKIPVVTVFSYDN